MLYHLLYPLHANISVFNVFRYISFRTILATLTALFLSFLLGPWLIRTLSRYQFEQPIREDGPERHFEKKGTPTMGGALILFCMIISTLLWARLDNVFVWLTIGVTLAYGSIGFMDDFRKLVKKDYHGLRGKYKFIMELLVALGVALILYLSSYSTTLAFPFFKHLVVDLGWAYILLVVFIIVGTSNAVNLTDGLDGLAIVPVMLCALTYTIFAYSTGHVKISQYLQIPFINGSGELAVFLGALVGAGLGFLWFNAYPASVFMGDIGSLSLGAAIGLVAVITKQEIVLVLAGGIFVIETMSVILQVASFKLTGRRIFRMAPIHHHFELKGWEEPKVIVRFWIISIILALAALGTLKLR